MEEAVVVRFHPLHLLLGESAGLVGGEGLPFGARLLESEVAVVAHVDRAPGWRMFLPGGVGVREPEDSGEGVERCRAAEAELSAVDVALLREVAAPEGASLRR